MLAQPIQRGTERIHSELDWERNSRISGDYIDRFGQLSKRLATTNRLSLQTVAREVADKFVEDVASAASANVSSGCRGRVKQPRQPPNMELFF
jgi:hypothetical protein